MQGFPKKGRLNTSLEFVQLQKLWRLTDHTRKSKNEKGKEIRDEMSNYFNAATLVDFEHIDIGENEVYQPLRGMSRAPDNVSICSRYTSCNKDLSQETLEDALTHGTFNRHNVKGERWMKSLVGFAGGSIWIPDIKDIRYQN